MISSQLRKQDMTMEQLKQYNGLGPEGRVLVAVNGKIFDVTKGIFVIFCNQVYVIFLNTGHQFLFVIFVY